MARQRLNRAIAPGDLFRHVASEKLYRVVHADRAATGWTFLVDIQGTRLVVKRYSNEDFARLTHPGCRGEDAYTAEEHDPYDAFSLSRSVTPGHLERSKASRELINPFTAVPLTREPKDTKEAGAIFRKLLSDSHFRAACFNERAEHCGTSQQRVRRIFLHFVQRGMRPEAVDSSLPNCGHKNDPAWATSATKPEGVTREGKRSRYGVNHGPNVDRSYRSCPGPKPKTPDDPRLVPGVIKKRVLQLMADIWISAPLGDWIQDLPGAFFSEDTSEKEWHCDVTAKKGGKRARRGRRSRPTYEKLTLHANFLLRKIPESIVKNTDTGDIKSFQLRADSVITQRMVRHFIQKLPPEVKVKRDEIGQNAYLLNHAPFRGHALSHIFGPGDVFQIDATIMDIYLVSMLSPIRVVSRPTLYLLIDVFSRMITGLYVGFEYPSMEACAQALENMVMDKAEFCAFYGLEGMTTTSWPCQIPPKIFHADRGGEFMKIDVWGRINTNFGLEVVNCRPYFPIWRSIIETRFGIVPGIMARNCCGIVEKHIEGRPHCYPLDAVHDIRSIMRQIIRATDIYHRTPLPDDTALPNMVADKVPNTPLNRWHWGMKHISGDIAKRLTVNEMRLATWTPTKAKIDRAGISCRGGYYRYPGNIVGAESETTVLCGPQMSKIIYKPYESPIVCDLADTNRFRLDGVDYLDLSDHLDQAAELRKAAKSELDVRATINQLNSQHETQRAWERRQAALRADGLKKPMTGDTATARTTESDIQHGRRRGASTRSAGTSHNEESPGSVANGASQNDAWAAADKFSKEMKRAALGLLQGRKK